VSADRKRVAIDSRFVFFTDEGLTAEVRIQMCHQQGRSPMQTILIVDDDLGFVMWLANTLRTNGYTTLPMTSAPEARRVIAELEIAEVDLVIVNPALLGASDLIDSLQMQQGFLRVLNIEGAVRRRAAGSHAAQREWLTKVFGALEELKTADGG
jgi:DNA-binding response OmpR family regulator